MRRSFCTTSVVLFAWSSMSPASGMKSGEQGFASSRISVSSDVKAFCIVPKQCDRPPSWLRKRGSFVSAGSASFIMR